MDFMLSRATRVTAQWASAPVQHAVARFWRDMEMTLSTTGFVPDNRLMICLAPALPPESYTLDVTETSSPSARRMIWARCTACWISAVITWG